MPRPKQPPTKVVAIRLPEDVYERWQEAADRAGRSVGSHLRAKLTEAAPPAKT